MSENHARGAPPPRPRKCKRLSADQWATLSAAQRRDFHRFRMAARRERQIDREPNSVHPRSGSIAGGNRNFRRIGNAGAKHPPHEHAREIARRQRQSARAASKGAST